MLVFNLIWLIRFRLSTYKGGGQILNLNVCNVVVKYYQEHIIKKRW